MPTARIDLLGGCQSVFPGRHKEQSPGTGTDHPEERRFDQVESIHNLVELLDFRGK